MHGIGQQRLDPGDLDVQWRTNLTRGLSDAAPPGVLPAVDFRLAYFADVFAPSTKGWEDALEDVDVDFLLEVDDEVVTPGWSVPPTKGFPALPKSLNRLAAWLDDRFGAGSAMLCIASLRQVRRYLADDELAATVHQRVADRIDGPVAIVAHSLGTVVAHQLLAACKVEGVGRLVTLGSPLALSTVRKRLRYPLDAPLEAGVWLNVFDPRDVVACAGGLKGHVRNAGFDEKPVRNGVNAHSAGAYLRSATVANALRQG